VKKTAVLTLLVFCLSWTRPWADSPSEPGNAASQSGIYSGQSGFNFIFTAAPKGFKDAGTMGGGGGFFLFVADKWELGFELTINGEAPSYYVFGVCAKRHWPITSRNTLYGGANLGVASYREKTSYPISGIIGTLIAVSPKLNLSGEFNHGEYSRFQVKLGVNFEKE